MTGICGACDKFASDLHNYKKGLCELHEKEVGFTDDFCCDDFNLDENVSAFLIKAMRKGDFNPMIIYFKV